MKFALAFMSGFFTTLLIQGLTSNAKTTPDYVQPMDVLVVGTIEGSDVPSKWRDKFRPKQMVSFSLPDSGSTLIMVWGCSNIPGESKPYCGWAISEQ